MTTRRRIIIDASPVCYWRHYAREKNPRARDALAWVRDFVEEARPDTFQVVLDSSTNWRYDVLPDYKKHRSPRPHGVEGMLREFAKRGAIVADGFEADDVVASIIADNPSDHTIIVSNDKDLLQLVCNTVIMHDPRVNKTYDAAAVEAKHRVPPSRLRLKLALWGDRSDGIDGVPGIGEARAADVASVHDWDYVRTAIETKTPAMLHDSLSPMLSDMVIQFGRRVATNYELIGLRTGLSVRPATTAA